MSDVASEHTGSAQCQPQQRTANEETMAPMEPHASAMMCRITARVLSLEKPLILTAESEPSPSMSWIC
eukprot:scaffold4405_cov31-Tisochrysis_lutea.AAC.2